MARSSSSRDGADAVTARACSPRPWNRPHRRDDPAITWLPEADEASRTFFASAGWAADGLARGLDTGAGEIREIRLHTGLTDA